MDGLLGSLGLTTAELTQLIFLGVVLLIGLFVLRVAFKLTATLFRIGCFGIILIVAAVYILNLLSGS